LIHKSKIEKLHTRVSHSTTFRRHSWLTLVVEKDVLPCHLMCHDIFFLSGQCMYSDYVRFGVNSIFFPPFISLFSTSICILPMNKIITTLQFFSLEVFFIFFEFQLFYLIKSLQIRKKKIIFILLQFLISRIEFLLFWFFIGMVYEFYLFLAILSSFFFFFMFASHSFYCYFFSNTILQN
jgi:hypothetical protein